MIMSSEMWEIWKEVVMDSDHTGVPSALEALIFQPA
jgi:hypothetical protein